MPGLVWANTNAEGAYPDIIAKEPVQIKNGQIIGRLLLTHGDAVVDGTITRGIIIVEGNLFIQTHAHIDGFVLVLGGQVTQEQGSYVHHRIWTISPNSPGTQHIAWMLLFMVLLVLLGLASALYWIARLFRNSTLYPQLKKLILTLEQRWPWLYILIGFLMSSILLVSFTELAWKTLFRHQMDSFDNIVIWLVRHFATTSLDSVMIAITDLGSAPFYGLLAVIVLGGLAFYRLWREAAALAICLAGGGVLNLLLKQLFERARPDMFHVIKETGYSFPSGHAMVSLCFMG